MNDIAPSEPQSRGESGFVTALNSYPIKGLSSVGHDHVALTAGNGFPNDRIYGFAKGNSGFDPASPKPLPKDRFLVLLEHAALAGLQTSIDPENLCLTIKDSANTTRIFDLRTKAGQRDASGYLAELLDLDASEIPFFAQAFPHRFTDVSVTSPQMMQAVSLINAASVRDLEEKAGVEIDPARFRGNILIDGWPAFAERALIGQQISVGDVSFKVLKHTRRCGATRVNPSTATRDLDVLALLKTHYGHLDMGVYMECSNAGLIACGDRVALI